MPNASSAANYGAFTVGSTAAVIVSATQKRKNLKIKNTHATQILYVGDDSSVDNTNGYPIAAGASETLEDFNGTVYGYGSGAGTTGRYFEVA